MPSLLKDFYLNEVMRNEVKDYLMQFLQSEALKRLFDENNESPTYGFAEAKIVIDKAFENLEILFAPKSEVKEQVNESR